MAKWIAEFPVTLGYYWIRNHGGSQDLDMAEVFESADGFRAVFFMGDDNTYRPSTDPSLRSAEWFGPIPPPEHQDKRAELERFLLFMLDRNLVATAYSEQIGEGINAFIGS